MNRFHWRAILAGLLLSCVFLAGCTTAQQDGMMQGEKKFTVLTSFYPVYLATMNVTRGVDGVEVKNMTKPQTGCLHDYQLTTEDLKTLEKAQAFVVNGAGMEAFLDKVVKQQKGLTIIDASREISLLKTGDKENPHVWVSVSNAIRQVQSIARQLSALDPAHAAAYEQNAAVYVAKLENLRAEMHRELDALPNRDIVTFHEAFPYLAEEFQLHIAAVIEREPGSEPTPKELEETVRKIRAANVRALFAEPQYSAGAADTIAKESGAILYTLDPVVTGDAGPDAYDAYIQAMQKNVKTLKTALQ